MAVAQRPFLAAVLLLVSSGLHRSSPLPTCPESCTCHRQSTPLLNCSSTGLSSLPEHIQDSVTELDLSHNFLDSFTLDRPRRNLRNVWLGNNSITHFSLCTERNLGGRHGRGRSLHLHRLRAWRGRGCVSWAPTLQLLSVERNQLEQLPHGLEGSETLQVLQLSFNRISSLQAADLSHLRQLRELHLQHNLITSLRPQMFQDLAQLQVLDLSFNMLTSLHPSMYFSLRNIGADVRLGGNRWQCDCSMRSLRRRMAYDSSRGLQAWSMVCASPSVVSGRDLLQLEEDDLNCFTAENGPELHRDITVYKGSEILLSCDTQDSMWWTPSGQASVSQPQAGLLINDITERDTGLYVCVSEEQKVVSVFTLQISKMEGARRKTRSLSRASRQIIPQGAPNRIGQDRNQRATQSDLTLAVCLSVFITFLIAFILGVLARPCIDILWKRVTKKKSSSETISVSSVEQRQYDNEAYFNDEESEHVETHRERRVTFSTVDFREDNNVKYYDTVAGGNQESMNNDECEAAEVEMDTNTPGDTGSENNLRQSSPEDNQRDGRDLSSLTDEGRTHSIEFEHIPDPVELVKMRSVSSCSDSSLSSPIQDQITQEDHSTPKSRQLIEDSAQQRADSTTARKVEVPQISIEGTSELPGFSSESFADCSPRANNINLTDPDLWQENEELFEFSDSVRSTSARSSSVRGSFNDSKLIVAPTSDKLKMDDMSSSSSYVSEDEPTQYIVNSDQEEEDDIERNHSKPVVTNACLKQDASFEQQSHTRPSVQFIDDYRYDSQSPPVRPEDYFSSQSSDSDGEDYTVTKGCVASVGVTSHGKSVDTRAPSSPAVYSSSSSSESEAEITDLKVEHLTGRVNEGMKIYEPETLSTVLDHQCISQIKRRVDISTPLPASDSSSSDESMGETTKSTIKKEQGEVDMVGFPINKHHLVSYDAPKPQWPAQNLEHATHSMHLDIRAPPTESSSGSDSDSKTTNHTERPRKVDTAGLPFKGSQTGSRDQDTKWPVLELENIPHVKRHLDIKAPSPPTDSSSNSDTEDETTKHMKKQEQAPLPASDSPFSSDSEDETTHHTERPAKVDIARLPFKGSQTGSYDRDTKWPVLDLEDTTRIKRRLDIKAPSPPPDSSSSSDTEDEMTNHIKTQEQGQMNMARLPSKVSQTVSHDPQPKWPVVDLEHTMRIKRRLDMKAPSPASDSSSSSDSEDETTHHTERPAKVDIGLPFIGSQTGSHDRDTKWPVLDLEDTTRIKRRLDIKAPSPPPDSSSSSDTEDEMTNHIKTQEQGQMNMARLPSKVSQTVSHDPQPQWPVVDLEHTMRIKRRLDIKATSPASDSSSSSDSEDETTHHTERPAKVDIGLPFIGSQTGSHDPDTKWPVLDLEHIPHVKRHLDIKAPLPPLQSLSNCDTVEEKISQIKKHEQGEVHVSRHPFQETKAESHDPETQWPVIDLERTMRIKRRLDIKATSPALDSSSSSDSEDEMTHHTERPGKVDIAGLPFQGSQTRNHVPDTRWPVLDLEHIPHVKRRLDIHSVEGKREETIKMSPSHSSGSSDKQEEGMVDLRYPPTRVEPDSKWPELDLSGVLRVKRRLNIKARSPIPSGSDHESEGGTTDLPVKMERDRIDVAIASYQPARKLPDTNMSVTPIKRHLNIERTSQPTDSCSSNSDHENRISSHTVKHEKDKGYTGIKNQEQQTKLHKLSLAVPYINRRMDIKAPSPQPDPVLSSVSPGSQRSNCSRSESEDEFKYHTKLGPGVSAISQTTEKESIRLPKTPVINISHNPKIDHKIKLQKYTVITDKVGDKTTIDNTSTTPEINPELQSRWATMNLGFSRFRKRLEITSHTHEPPNLPSSPPPDSPSSSSSESETGSKSNKARQKRRKVGKQGLIPTGPSLTPENKPGNVSLSLKGRDNNSGNSVEIAERLRKDYTLPSIEEKPNADTTLTGLPPLQQLPDSSSNSENKNTSTVHADEEWRGRSQPPVVINKDAPQSQTVEEQRKAGVELKSQTSKVGEESDAVWPHLSLTNIPRVRRALDIRAPLTRESSSSSNSEDEKVDHSVPELSLGVPHVKRRLDVKAPLPEPSHSPSSSSESENEVTGYAVHQSKHASNMSEMTDNDSLITYKRLIIKPSSPPSNSFSPSGKGQTKQRHMGAEMLTNAQEGPFHSVGDRNASLAPKTAPRTSFDDVVKKRIEQQRHTTNADLPPEIRWTGIGHQLSDHGKAGVPLMQHSSLSANSVSLASSRVLNTFDKPPSSTNEILRAESDDKNKRKGLSALKAMSSERRKWDTLDENLDKAASPLFDDHGPKGDISDIKPLTQLHLSSTSVDERRATDLLYGIPRYRRHNIGGAEPSLTAPPPIPATPPPYEAVGLTWRSSQSSTKKELEGTTSNQSRNTWESNQSSLTSDKLVDYFDSSNMNSSDV